MLHDFLMTEKSVLLILPSLEADRRQPGFFERIQFNKNIAMQVLVIDKQSLKLKKRYELPAGFAFHYGNAWEENDGTIHFEASLYPNVDLLHSLSDVMYGKMDHVEAGSKTAFYTLKPNGSHSMHKLSNDSEFPRVCKHVVGAKNNYLYHLSAKNNGLWSDSVAAIDTNTGREQSYHFGDDYLVEEHIPVCPKNKEGTGYLIGTALHVPSKRTCLNIFAASDLSSGPMAKAWLPYHLPLGFHGNFQAA